MLKKCVALLDAGEETRPITLDISKAFDKVWHSYKLKVYGVVSPILSILESFLQECSLKVVLDASFHFFISPMLEFLRDFFLCWSSSGISVGPNIIPSFY